LQIDPQRKKFVKPLPYVTLPSTVLHKLAEGAAQATTKTEQKRTVITKEN